MNSDRPLLVVTPGEPAGIGPECALGLAALHPELQLLLVADPGLLRETASRFSIDLPVVAWRPGSAVPEGTVGCLPVEMAAPAVPGRLDTANAHYVLDCLRQAVRLVRDHDRAALVTGPVHKGVINEAGIPFTGHTEFLAAESGVPRVVMMLAAGSLRVALATTHLPLRAVPDAITTDSLGETLRIIDHDLREYFGLQRPRIQVLGLNPHAGEGGHLGAEDDTVVLPAIRQAVEAGISAYGPVPADTAFTAPAMERCDVVLAMYHDQGLPVLKHAGFGRSVNITLGLPFVRTSVDHGTALDIAGQGVADSSSFFHAARMAVLMCGGAHG